MIDFLASPPIRPSSDSNMELILISAGVVVGVAIFGFFPIQLARQNRHREAIAAVIVLWGLITAASICLTINQQKEWSATYLQHVETGYFDPRDTTDKPAMPIGFWSALTACYAVIVIWANRRS
jgi:hypothetical protein